MFVGGLLGFTGGLSEGVSDRISDEVETGLQTLLTLSGRSGLDRSSVTFLGRCANAAVRALSSSSTPL